MNILKKRYDDLWAALSIEGAPIHPRWLAQRAAQLWPNKKALLCGEDSITFHQLAIRALAVTHAITKRGITPHDRILIIYENSIEFFIAYYGAWQTGALIAPLNVFLQERELNHIVNDATPRLIIASAVQQEKLKTLTNLPDVVTLETLEEEGSRTPAPPSQTTDDSLEKTAILLYTSGTTGLPKGVMLSGKAIVTNCIQGICNFNFTDQERIYAALPLFHSYMQNTALWCSFIVGATVIIVPAIKRSALLRGLDHKPTAVLGIPHLFGLFCLMPQAHFSHAKLIFSGGDALPISIKTGFELIFGRKLGNGYGLTETAPLIAANTDDCYAPATCVGKPFLGIEIEIRNELNTPCPQGEVGSIWVKGDNIMQGYHKAPEATAAVISNGWLNTGDLGYLDQFGRLTIAGREKDLLISKGVKIYPQEIELVLTSHPSVSLAAVVGKQINNEDQPIAFVVSETTDNNLANELKTWCQKRLAPYKVPLYIIIRRTLPMTSTGKIDKKILREEVKDFQNDIISSL